jgi:hypothetical protein
MPSAHLPEERLQHGRSHSSSTLGPSDMTVSWDPGLLKPRNLFIDQLNNCCRVHRIIMELVGLLGRRL